MNNKSPFIIMRRACLMEDEGRDEYIKACESKAEAKAWIAAQKGEYFQPGDYFIMEVSK